MPFTLLLIPFCVFMDISPDRKTAPEPSSLSASLDTTYQCSMISVTFTVRSSLTLANNSSAILVGSAVRLSTCPARQRNPEQLYAIAYSSHDPITIVFVPTCRPCLPEMKTMASAPSGTERPSERLALVDLHDGDSICCHISKSDLDFIICLEKGFETACLRSQSSQLSPYWTSGRLSFQNSNCFRWLTSSCVNLLVDNL